MRRRLIAGGAGRSLASVASVFLRRGAVHDPNFGRGLHYFASRGSDVVIRTVILVAGGAGYTANDTCKALARAGYTPIVLDNLSAGHPWAVKWGPLVKADIADKETA